MTVCSCFIYQDRFLALEEHSLAKVANLESYIVDVQKDKDGLGRHLEDLVIFGSFTFCFGQSCKI